MCRLSTYPMSLAFIIYADGVWESDRIVMFETSHQSHAASDVNNHTWDRAVPMKYPLVDEQHEIDCVGDACYPGRCEMRHIIEDDCGCGGSASCPNGNGCGNGMPFKRQGLLNL
ncbi:hypothetical protein V2G26_021039 [Clonostachys chloroleuca]